MLALLATTCAGALSAAPPEPSATASAVDASWILARLARPAPTRTDFVELRGSPLLKAPLRIEGEYRRPDDDTLVRAVRARAFGVDDVVALELGAVAGEHRTEARLQAL